MSQLVSHLQAAQDLSLGCKLIRAGVPGASLMFEPSFMHVCQNLLPNPFRIT